MVGLFDKPTVAEYELALRKASPIEVIEEVFLDKPLYRASVIKEVITRAKWAGISPIKWCYCELKFALERYENKQITQTKPTESTEETNARNRAFAENQKELYDKFWPAGKP